MKQSVSVVVLGAVIFVLLAFAIYIFNSFPYLLALVLLAEWLALALAVLGPLVAPAIRKGWLGRVVAVLLTIGLANIYMLFLASRWGVEPEGWFRSTLTFEAAVLNGALRLAAYVVAFLDALLKTVLGLHRGPIGSFFSEVVAALDGGLHGPLEVQADFEGLRLGLLVNLFVGILASIFSAQVLKGLLPAGRGGAHGGGESGH